MGKSKNIAPLADLLTAWARGVVTGKTETPEARAGSLALANLLVLMAHQPKL